MEKATLGFRLVYKIWQILKRFTGTFCRARTLKLGGSTVPSFFRFSFRATLYFYLMNALVYVDIRKTQFCCPILINISSECIDYTV